MLLSFHRVLKVLKGVKTRKVEVGDYCCAEKRIASSKIDTYLVSPNSSSGDQCYITAEWLINIIQVAITFKLPAGFRSVSIPSLEKKNAMAALSSATGAKGDSF